MKNLIKKTYQLCILKIGPQDLPHSLPLLYVSLILSLLLDSVYYSAVSFQVSLVQAFIQTFPLTLTPLVLTWGLLKYYNRTERFVQTVLALTLKGIMLTLIESESLWVNTSFA